LQFKRQTPPFIIEAGTMTPNEAYDHAAKVAGTVLRKEAEIWAGATKCGWDSEKLALAVKVEEAIKLLKQ
jgi:hypothetical protein